MHAPSPERKSVSPHSSNGVRAFLALLVGNIALAFGPWFVRLADTGPVAAAFWRLALAAPLLVLMAAMTGWRPGGWPLRRWMFLAIAAVAFAADLASWHVGILRTTLANANLFGNSTILIFPIYGFIAARTLPTRTQALALVLATIGGTMLMGRSYGLDPRHFVGDLLCVLAGVLYTFYFVFMARVRESTPPVPALALATLASIVPALLFALLLGERIMPHDWTPLFALALLSQVLGQGLIIYALDKVSPLIVGISILIQPVAGGILGWFVFGERLGAPDLIGAGLVAAALVLVRQRPATTMPVPVSGTGPAVAIPAEAHREEFRGDS